MKSIYSIATVLALFQLAYAQIPNAGFEDWQGGEAVGWHSNNFPGFPTAVEQTDDAYSGSSAANVLVADFSGQTYVGAIISGGVTMPFFSISENYEALNGYYKYIANGTKEWGGVLVEFYDGPFGQLVALGTANLLPSDSYAEFSIAMDYTIGNGNPAATCKITFTHAAQGETSIGNTFTIDDLFFSGMTSVDEPASNAVPAEFSLMQNYPNPFNPSTTIGFTLASAADVQISIYNTLGELVDVALQSHVPAGSHSITWNAGELPSGLYIYRLEAGGMIETKKMLLNR